MKKFALIVMAGILGLSAYADTKTMLVVSGADGTKRQFDITQVKHITFDNDNEKMTISHFDGDEEFDINAIDEMIFGVVDGIESVYDFNMGSDLNLVVDHGMVLASQPEKELVLRIFDMNGRLVDTATAFAELTYDLSQLPGGIYIVSVNDKAIKFIR